MGIDEFRNFRPWSCFIRLLPRRLVYLGRRLTLCRVLFPFLPCRLIGIDIYLQQSYRILLLLLLLILRVGDLLFRLILA